MDERVVKWTQKRSDQLLSGIRWDLHGKSARAMQYKRREEVRDTVSGKMCSCDKRYEVPTSSRLPHVSPVFFQIVLPS